MTCEIVIMNRHAICLAADSAVTITHTAGAKIEKRYYKSVNKLFQLSSNRPVGLMIYGAGDLQQAPWELLAKEYRQYLGDKSFDSLDLYSQDLFTFLENAVEIFPKSYQEDVFTAAIEKSAFSFFFQVINEDASYKSATTDGDKITAASNVLDTVLANLSAKAFMPKFDQNDIDEAVKLYHDALAKNISASKIIIDADKLASLGIIGVIKGQFYLAESGVVIAGFGDKDYYPGYKEFKCFGFMMGKLCVVESSTEQISYQKNSHIEAFATTSMVDTFNLGISEKTFTHAIECAETAMTDLLKDLGKDTNPAAPTLVQNRLREFTDNLIQLCRQDNYAPLARVISALPIDEMAELAETLVALESLKEKVTRPTESVGGPVDVAVITKGDGLIWVKRKHYFTAELNPRYFQRQTK